MKPQNKLLLKLAISEIGLAVLCWLMYVGLVWFIQQAHNPNTANAPFIFAIMCAIAFVVCSFLMAYTTIRDREG